MKGSTSTNLLFLHILTLHFSPPNFRFVFFSHDCTPRLPFIAKLLVHLSIYLLYRMSLSKAPRKTMFRFVLSRNASTSNVPSPARIQLKKPAEAGHFQYSRNWSRDPRFVKVAIQKGDTPYQYVFSFHCNFWITSVF